LQRAEIFKSSVLVDAINYVGWPLLAIYGFSMFVYPWLEGDWQHVQTVWDRWQTLNAGALAFVASAIAFNISRFNENQQRERDFVAAKAFLPSTLSRLMEYCADSAHILQALWEPSASRSDKLACPDIPQDYRDVFSNCIRHANPSVGTYLSTILVRLQVHDARLRDAIAETARKHERVVDRHTLIAYLLRLGELKVLLSKLFGFARGEENFEIKPMTWEDFRSAYLGLDLEIDDFFIDENMNLQAFTTRWLKRAEKQSVEARK
jgi:hypothetical protein